MRGGSDFSRRTLLHLILGGLYAQGTLPAAPPTVSDRLRGFSLGARFCRRYRVDATVSLLGVPLITKQNVGGAYASIELGSTSASSAIVLQFAAGSWPEHTRVLNRFGIWREAIIEQGAEPPEIDFAGLLTDSREQNLAEARSAFLASRAPAQAIVARGHASGGAMRTWVERMELPPSRAWTDASTILAEAIRHDPAVPARETMSGECTTFFHTMRNAGLEKQLELRRRFFHSGKPYILELHRRPESPLTLSGIIRDTLGIRCSEFQTTYAPEDGSGLPARIQYRARSFLRLTFEWQPDAAQPPIPWVFEESI
jgi:hypothetical protein